MKTVSGILLTLLFIGMLTLVFNIQPVEASGTIYIRADGSIEGTTDIVTVDNVTYTFTDNIYDSIVVERDSIVVDGAGYTLQGNGSGSGINVAWRNNVTIKNTEIKSFEKGILLYRSSNNTIYGNNITANNEYGILLTQTSINNTLFENNMSNNLNAIYIFDSHYHIISRNTLSNNGGCICLEICQHNTISDNTMTNNNYGIRLGYHSRSNSVFGNYIAANSGSGVTLAHSSNNIIYGNNITNNLDGVSLDESFGNRFYHNNFIDNTRQVNDVTPDVPITFPPTVVFRNFWDDGAGKGNYWSDYKERYPNATELDGSGVWNTSYVIAENNQDNYPIVPEFPSFLLLPLFMITTLLAVAVCRRKHAMRIIS